MKLYACDTCHYLFLSEQSATQCPDCGKYTVRCADCEEIKEFDSRHYEADDWDNGGQVSGS